MKFKLEISCDNAAFEDVGIQHEIARILVTVSGQVDRGNVSDDYHVIRDINGNPVGTYTLQEGE